MRTAKRYSRPLSTWSRRAAPASCVAATWGFPVVLNVRRVDGPHAGRAHAADTRARLRRWVGEGYDAGDIMSDDGRGVGDLHVEHIGDPGAAGALGRLCRDKWRPGRYVWAKRELVEMLRGLGRRAPRMPSEVKRRIAQFLPPPGQGEWLRGTPVAAERIERVMMQADPDLGLQAEIRFWPKEPIPLGTIRVNATSFVLDRGGSDSNGTRWVW